MYIEPNLPSAAALRRALAAGERVQVFQPGLGSVPAGIATVSVEGPHYPKPHTWYAKVRIENGRVTGICK